MKQVVLRIDKASATARTLWTDAINLRGLGKLRVERASHVEFDDSRQTWYVATPGWNLLKDGFTTREEALAWESRWANEQVKLCK